jgi:hypothetical protein
MKRARIAAIFALATLSTVPMGLVLGQNESDAAPREPELSLEATRDDVEEDSPARRSLDAIHADLVELRFEQALSAIEALLGSNELLEDDRVEALVLRAQGHVAFGDLKAAEQDYRDILSLRAGFVPDPSMTPRKALERFEKVQAAMIGRVILRMLPPDADVTVDGRPIPVGAEGEIALVAGEHRLHASRAGFDAETQTVFVAAGRSASLELRLRPNARSVIVFTEPDGVDVTLDGTWVGRTERPDPDSIDVAGAPAQLLLENVPLGEHTIELSRDCYRNERRTDFLDVDLLNVTPKLYKKVRMIPVRATLVAESGPVGARVLVDGEDVGAIPLEPHALCPGLHEIEVRRGERRIWSDSREFSEGETTSLPVEARPNVLIVGAPDWPSELIRYRSMVNEVGAEARAPRGDPSELSTWHGADVPRDVDLVLARRAGPREGETDTWFAYSPILEYTTPLDLARADLGRPRWTLPSWGLRTVDSEVGGALRVAQVTEGSAAAAAGIARGDRILSVGGARVASTHQLRRFLDASSWKAPLAVEWTTTEGEPRRANLRAAPSVLLESDPEGRSGSAAIRAAWALASAEGDGEWAAAAQANLALLYSAHGHHESAARSWRRVDWEDRAGIGQGTAQYYLGRELERLGLESEAAAAYRRAAHSSGTAVDDEGPRIAGAARDRLSDLGLATD